jgi:hypothetical protein
MHCYTTWSHFGTDGVGKLSAWNGLHEDSLRARLPRACAPTLPHFLFGYFDAGPSALAANGEARVASTLLLLEAATRGAMTRTGMASVTDINTNILMNALRDAIQQG